MEKEEKRKRALLQAWHENKCYYLRLDPTVTPMFPEIPEFYFDPTVGTWYQMPELPPQVDVWGKLGFPHMARLPSEAFRETDSPLPDPTYIYPPGVVKVSYLYGQPMSLDPSFNNAQVDMIEPEPSIYPQEAATIDNSSNLKIRVHHNNPPLCYIDPETGQEVPIPEEYCNPAHNSIIQNINRLQPTAAPSLDTIGASYNDLILPSVYGASEQCNVDSKEYAAELSDKPPPNSLPDYQRNVTEIYPQNITKDHSRTQVKSAVASEEGISRARCGHSNEKSSLLTMKLPASWRITKDAKGRVYYYNIKTKVTQWTPPNGTESTPENESSSTNLVKGENLTTHHVDMHGESPESEDDEEMEEIDDNEDTTVDENGEDSDIDEEEEDVDINLDMDLDAKILDNPQGPYSDLSDQERTLLLRFSKLSKEERQNERRQKRERDREKREYERKRRRERHGKHRKDGLVTEHLIPVIFRAEL